MKKEGLYSSLKIGFNTPPAWTWATTYWPRIVLTFSPRNNPSASTINLKRYRDNEGILRFLIRGENYANVFGWVAGNLIGNAVAILTDSSGRKQQLEFGFQVNGTWAPLSLPLSGFAGDSGFNWESVRSLEFTFEVQVGSGTIAYTGCCIWVCAGPFFFMDPLECRIRFKAEEGGSLVQRVIAIHPTSGQDTTAITNTPSDTITMVQTNGDVFRLTAPELRFSHWENGFTNNVRDYIPDGDATLTVYYGSVQQANLTLQSAPDGKAFIIGGQRFYASVTPLRLSLGQTIHVEVVDKNNFLHWEDNNTSAVRELTMDEDKTIFATFKPGTSSDDGEEDWTWAWIVGGIAAVTGVSALAYYLAKRRRKKNG